MTGLFILLLLFLFNSSPGFSSDSGANSSHVNSYGEKTMIKKGSKKPPKIKLFEANTLVLPSGENLSTTFEDWKDIEYLFIRKDATVLDNFYYRDLTHHFTHQLPGSAILHDKDYMDLTFADCPGANTPMAPLLEKAHNDQLDECFRSCFHLEEKVIWRWPEPHERVYHRPGNGLVGVFLEHLRFGFNPRYHQFIKCLCKFHYGILIFKLSPNAIKWIIWFLGCNVKGYLPTFKLFHQLFSLAKSNMAPLYEFWFRYEECGFKKRGPNPIVKLGSLKGWHEQWVFVQFEDL